MNNTSLAEDPKFATNEARVANRTELIQIITDVLMEQSRDHWLKKFMGLGYGFFLDLQCPKIDRLFSEFHSALLTISNRLLSILK